MLTMAGYSYEYLSPDNFDLPSARVEDGVLAPDAQGFRAMIVRANDSLTVDGVGKLVEFAHAGLPIIFSSGLPSSYLGTNDAKTVADAQRSLNETTSLPNVHVTDSYDGLASKLESLGILPATRLSTNGTWYTIWRSDNETNEDYIFVYNDAMELPHGEGYSEGTLEFNSTGIPYEFNAWTGEQTPILTYTQIENSTSIPIKLGGNQSTIVAFLPEPLNSSSYPHTHLTDVSDDILAVAPSGDGKIVLKVGPGSSSPSYTDSTGTKKILPPVHVSPITLENWTLTVEHWDPPSNLSDIEGGARKHNTTHHLPRLVSWQDILGLQNVSGRGYYSTSFEWPPSDGVDAVDGAIIDFGFVVHTLRVSVNGHPLPPLDVTAAKADIGHLLVRGKNVVEAVVATPLGNVLRPIWYQLQTSGTGPSDPVAGGPPPPAGDYGLLRDVVVRPYREVVVG